MTKRLALFGPIVIASALACSRAVTGNLTPIQRSLIQQDYMVAVEEGGPHDGGGRTTAYSFFANEKGLALVFRKRSLHPGSAIGYHRNEVDEIYYVLSGRGELTLDGVRQIVGPGTAILTRAGSSHGLRQTGTEDLVIIINYQRETP
jgi:mannose-6-phosphate isomerase-like protein (cupin superfamily)